MSLFLGTLSTSPCPKGVKMEDLIEIKKGPKDVNLMSPLTWAYIGDCVYELYIRTKLINETNLKHSYKVVKTARVEHILKTE